MLLIQLTVPPGVMGVPGEVSVTVAVHVVGALTGTEDGVQRIAVDVERCVTVRVKLPELVEWSVSPEYVPVIM